MREEVLRCSWLVQRCYRIVEDHGQAHPGLRDAFLDNGSGYLLVIFAGIEMQAHHARADIVGVRTGMNLRGSFYRDGRSKLAVDEGFGEIVAFPGPIVDMDACFLPVG